MNEIEDINVLNIDTENSTIDVSRLVSTKINQNSFIVSDADEELLILISFKGITNLKSMKIYSLKSIIQSMEDEMDISQPKEINIYILNNLNINFDDISSFEYDKSIKCSIKKLSKGQNINLQKTSKNAIKFKKIKHLAIYIQSNQKNTENTIINGIQLHTNVEKNSISFKGGSQNKPVKETRVTQHNKYEFEQLDQCNLAALHELPLNFDNTEHSHTVSDYLLNSVNIYKQSKEECKLTECFGLKRIRTVLDKYNSYISQQQQLNEISIEPTNLLCYDKNYDDVKLMNDFNHLLFNHCHQFEDIYNILCNDQQPCDLLKCPIVRRNNRNRLIETQPLYFGGHIVRQQLIDRIHSYYFHSYDIGYKFKQNQLVIHEDSEDCKVQHDDDLDRTVLSMKEFISSKHKSYSHITELRRLSNVTNKFSMKMYEQKYESEYSYGYRYFYWEHYKNNFATKDDIHFLAGTKLGDQPSANTGQRLYEWYIRKKSSNFKQEMLNNEICGITASFWSQLEQKSKIMVLTEVARKLWCPRQRSAVFYGMKFGQLITQNHLIGMMIYCNSDLLQRKFTATFRRLNETETDDEMKARHSNYYHLGKLLREIVEFHGMKWPHDAPLSMNLYHGVTEQLAFSSLNAFIKGPLSTTTDFAVALNFCNSAGVILNIDPYGYEWFYEMENTEAATRICCFDCSWISDFVNEQEIFFIGGLNKFSFKTIVEAQTSANYGKYVHGIQQMTYFMSNGESIFSFDNIAKTSEERQMVFRLLSHELNRYYPEHEYAHDFKNCPQLIKQMLHGQCQGIRSIYFMNRGNVESKLHELLFKYDNGWIKVELLMTLCPNNQRIVFNAIQYDLSFICQSSVYSSVLKYVHNNRQTCLKAVEINIDPKYSRQMEEYIKQYCDDFRKLRWCIHIKCGSKFDGLKASEEQKKKLYRCRIIMERYTLYIDAGDWKQLLNKMISNTPNQSTHDQ
eukprot:291251_1